MTLTTTPTAEQIAQHYAACIDSVRLINAGKPEGMDDDEWADCRKRNQDHLNTMLAKDFWTDQDLELLRQAAGA